MCGELGVDFGAVRVGQLARPRLYPRPLRPASQKGRHLYELELHYAPVRPGRGVGGLCRTARKNSFWRQVERRNRRVARRRRAGITHASAPPD